MAGSWRWWVYLALVCALGYGRMLERLMRGSGGFWSQFGPPLGATVVSVGVASWLVGRATLWLWFWRLVHGCVGLALVGGLAFAVFLATIPVRAPAVLTLVSSLTLWPAFVALGRYAYRSPRLWAPRS